MKSLFEQIGIEQSTVDEETIDFIYDFVEKHGGLDAVKQEMAARGARLWLLFSSPEHEVLSELL